MRKQLVAVLFSLALASPTAAQDWGDLDGTFLFKGTPLTPNKITPTKDPEFCGKHPLVEEALVVNKDNKGIANVCIYLVDATKPKIHPDYEKAAKEKVVVDNENCRFAPHVSGLRVGHKIDLGAVDGA